MRLVGRWAKLPPFRFNCAPICSWLPVDAWSSERRIRTDLYISSALQRMRKGDLMVKLPYICMILNKYSLLELPGPLCFLILFLSGLETWPLFPEASTNDQIKYLIEKWQAGFKVSADSVCYISVELAMSSNLSTSILLFSTRKLQPERLNEHPRSGISFLAGMSQEP